MATWGMITYVVPHRHARGGRSVCAFTLRLFVISFTIEGGKGYKWSLLLIHTAEMIKNKSVVFNKMTGCLNESAVRELKEGEQIKVN